MLPLTVCTGPSWEQTRSLIEREFTLDIVIASHDPLRWNFSDSTDLSEALLIATRRPERQSAVEHRTNFVNLWHNPDGVLDAHRTARAIEKTTPASYEGTGTALLEVDGRHIGEVLRIPESKLAGRQWAGVQFARADVVRSALRLLNDGEVWIPGEAEAIGVPLCELNSLGEIGPDIRDVRDGFEPTNAVTAYPMVENHDTEKRRCMATKPDKYLAPLVKPRPTRPLRAVDQLWPKAGRLLISARLRLNTVRVVAMHSDKNVLASMWWPVRIDSEPTEKALAVWINSSLGLLALLAIRNTTQGSWVQLKKAYLQHLPVIEPASHCTVAASGPLESLRQYASRRIRTPAGDGQLPGASHAGRRHLQDSGIAQPRHFTRPIGLGASDLESATVGSAAQLSYESISYIVNCNRDNINYCRYCIGSNHGCSAYFTNHYS